MCSDAVFPDIPGFRIQRPLGWGGMGVVYEATEEKLDRTVALKTMPASGRWERFRRELAAFSRLEHPAFVAVYSHGKTAEQYYYSMELVQGRPLAAYLATMRQQGQLPRGQRLRKRLDLVLRVASAIAHAHQRGVFHRDLTPANILISRRGSVKIIDLGLAEIAGLETQTDSGSVFGTPRYLCPERLLGRRDTHDALQDIYGLGVILYELVTYAHPFPHETVEELLEKVQRTLPVLPRRHNPYLPRELEGVLLRAVARDPHARYASMDAFASDLEGILSGRPATPHRSTSLARFLQNLRWDSAVVRILLSAIISGVLLAAGYALYTAIT